MSRFPSNRARVVGVHHVPVFPPENLRGAYRWAVVLEDEEGGWSRRIVHGDEPLPKVGTWLT